MVQAESRAAPSQPRRTMMAGGALLLTTVFWGAMVPLTALLLEHFDPWFLAGARYIVALPFLWLFVALARDRVSWRGLRPRPSKSVTERTLDSATVIGLPVMIPPLIVQIW